MNKNTFVLLIAIFCISFSATAQNREESNKAINDGIKKYNAQDYNGAIAAFTRAVRLDPENQLAYYNRGLSKNGLKDYNGAIADCDKAIKINPGEANAYNIRGLAYQGLGKNKEALSDYKKAIKLNPKNYSPYFNRGLLFINSGDTKNALENLSKSIELNPEHEPSYQHRGLIYYQQSKYEEAIVDFNQTVYMNPKNPRNYVNRGIVKTDQKDYEGAKDDYAKAISLNPRLPDAYYNLGVCYHNLGDLRMACNNWSKSLELGNKDAQNALESAGCVDTENNNEVVNENSYTITQSHLEIVKTNENQIKNYLTNNELDPIEGIWKANRTEVVDNASKDEELNYATVAIVKDTLNTSRDFIIIALEGGGYPLYSIIGEFESTAYDKVYSSDHFAADGTKESWNFTINNVGMLSAIKEVQEGGSQISKEIFYLKKFPKQGSSSKPKRPTAGNEVLATGTGFVISEDGIIATNAHVLGNSAKITITFSTDTGKETFPVKVLFKDEFNDVALVKIDDASFAGFSNIPYKLNENHAVGQSAFTIGYPLTSEMGESFKLANGIISSLSGAKDDIRYMQVTVPLQPGNSGGPLFNMDGEVIGITSARLDSRAVGTDVQNVNYALKVTFLQNLMKLVPNFQNSFSTNNLNGVSLDKQVLTLKPFIGLIKTY